MIGYAMHSKLFQRCVPKEEIGQKAVQSTLLVRLIVFEKAFLNLLKKNQDSIEL